MRRVSQEGVMAGRKQRVMCIPVGLACDEPIVAWLFLWIRKFNRKVARTRSHSPEHHPSL